MIKTINKSTSRLRKSYWIAISIIAVSILINFFLVSITISHQLDDVSIINTAGRQRMLSQKLIKEIILSKKEDLAKTLKVWSKNQNFLQHGVSPKLKNLFNEIQPEFEELINIAQEILSVSDKTVNLEETLKLQERYLEGMENIVYEFEVEAKAKIDRLKRIELILTFFALLVLALEILFLFRPAAHHIDNIVEHLSGSEKKYKTMAEENKALFNTSEQSYKELQSLNFAIDRTSLVASLNLEGEVIYLSQKFKNLLDISKEPVGILFSDIISTVHGEQRFIKNLISTPRSEIWVGGVNATTKEGRKICLEMSIIPFNQAGIKQNMLILCNDLTLRKNAEKEVARLNEEQFKSEILLQKNMALQVMESQEAERKRIAKDMHDGIGQMLTALKFNIESIQLSNIEKANNQLTLIKKIAGDLIKGVRVATFNLTPPELGDYGIATGLSKLAEGLNTLTGKNIVFYNKSNFTQRFEFNKEINIYRIVQEAVNNAIKYSEAEHIIITCSHTEEMLSISVDDNGKGFDKSKLKEKSRKDGSGMGLAFMKERASYIDGRIFISSAQGEGSKITINLPI